MTPRYLKSKSCLSEIEEFCRGAERTGGIRFQDKARLLKVVKTAVPLDQLPSPLQAVLGYEFYALEEDKRPREFRLPPTAGDAFYKACLDTLDDLAYDIKFALDALQTHALQASARSRETQSGKARRGSSTSRRRSPISAHFGTASARIAPAWIRRLSA